MEVKHLRKGQNQLITWFDQGSRDLPWRTAASNSEGLKSSAAHASTPLKDSVKKWEVHRNKSYLRNPYNTWISEIMLQQTQVVTVIKYYQKWMQSFPTLETLAASPLDQVLEHWAGLGYYSRARNIHKTAQILVADYDGVFPAVRSELLKLPGIGEYTAGAILSLAMGLQEPILDGNCIRVLSRIFRLDFFPLKAAELKIYWQKADEWVKHNAPEKVNEAIMELGAKVCTPTQPKCLECPLQDICPSFNQADWALYPPPKPRPQTQELNLNALIIHQGDKYYLGHNSRWPFVKRNLSFALIEELETLIQQLADSAQFKGVIIEQKALGTISHKITKYKLNFKVSSLKLNNHLNADVLEEFFKEISFENPKIFKAEEMPGITKLNAKIWQLYTD